jgi:hypothetical protein
VDRVGREGDRGKPQREKIKMREREKNEKISASFVRLAGTLALDLSSVYCEGGRGGQNVGWKRGEGGERRREECHPISFPLNYWDINKPTLFPSKANNVEA